MLLNGLHLTKCEAAAAQLIFSPYTWFFPNPIPSSGSEESVPEAQPYFASKLSSFLSPGFMGGNRQRQSKTDKQTKQRTQTGME